MPYASPQVRLNRFSILLVLTAIAKPRPSPTLFYFPGLSAQPWYERKQFPWTKLLEDNYAMIKNEYVQFQSEQSDYAMKESEQKLHQGDWNWYSYITKGKINSTFEKQCPGTSALLQQIPGLMTEIPFAYAFFSNLKANSSIKAHSAPCNLRLRCHFPLIVPTNCGMRVGDTSRPWEEGKCTIFDDSYDHETWNDNTTDDRVVLLFDIWHPELELSEQTALQAMFDEAKGKGWLQ